MFVYVDGSQLEWRVACQCSGELVGIQEIRDKVDFHSLNQESFGLPSRLIAKKYIFRTIFNRGKGYAFSVDPDFMHVSTSVKYWDDVGQKFYEKYWRLNKWHDELVQTVAEGKPIVSPLGLFWNIPMGTKWDPYAVPVTMAINYPVQGTAAVIMATARVSIYKRLRKLGLLKECLMVSTVHDSITIDCPDHLVPTIVELFNSVFDDLVKNIRNYFQYDWIVPLAGECKIGKDMKNLEKVT